MNVKILSIFCERVFSDSELKFDVQQILIYMQSKIRAKKVSFIFIWLIIVKFFSVIFSQNYNLWVFMMSIRRVSTLSVWLGSFSYYLYILSNKFFKHSLLRMKKIGMRPATSRILSWRRTVVIFHYFVSRNKKIDFPILFKWHL